MKTTADRKPAGPGPEAGPEAAIAAAAQQAPHAVLQAASEPIFDLRLVPFPPEYSAGARNAVSTCLRIEPAEKVTLIADEACMQVAASMAVDRAEPACTPPRRR